MAYYWYIHIHMHIHMRQKTDTYTHTRAQTHIHTHAHIHAHIHAHTHRYKYIIFNRRDLRLKHTKHLSAHEIFVTLWLNDGFTRIGTNEHRLPSHTHTQIDTHTSLPYNTHHTSYIIHTSYVIHTYTIHTYIIHTYIIQACIQHRYRNIISIIIRLHYKQQHQIYIQCNHKKEPRTLPMPSLLSIPLPNTNTLPFSVLCVSIIS